MAYAFTNLMNLADSNKEDKSTAPIAKSSMGAGASGGVSSGGAGQLQQAPMPNKGAVVAQQYEAAKPLVANAVQASKGNLRSMGTQGRTEIGEQETKYRTDNTFDSGGYTPEKVDAFVTTGEGDLNGLQKLLGGTVQAPKAFDATPPSATRLGGVLTGGGGQYLASNLGGGTGALERIAAATEGGDVTQTAVDEATTLGGIAGARETAATNEVGGRWKTDTEAARVQVRNALAAARSRILGDDAGQTALEQTAFDQAGSSEQAALEKTALEQAEPELRNLFGDTTNPTRQGYEPAILQAIRDSIRKSATAPTVRNAKDVITQGEYDQLSRIGGLTGEVVPGMSEAANYGGQYTLDPSFIEAIKKLIPTTPGPMQGGNQMTPTSAPGDMFGGASPGDGRQPVGYSGPVEAPAPGAMALPGGAAPAPLSTGDKASQTAVQIMSSGWGDPNTTSILTGGHDILGTWF